MHHDFEPYDVLIGTHNRVNGLEEAMRQLQLAQVELSEVVRKQNNLIKQTKHNEEQLRIAYNHQAGLIKELVALCIKTNEK